MSDAPTVERLEAQLHELVAERDRLRSEGGDAAALAANRRELARLQAALSDALIARFLPAA